jgi:ribosome-associated toxin RatA of RatAB toxin-antitoxin module
MRDVVAVALRDLLKSAGLALSCCFLAGLSTPAISADWALSETQLRQLRAGGIVAEGEIAADRMAADVRAAVQVSAPPETVFRTLTDCSLALRFVPHLKRCAVIDTAPDGSWQEVEHESDYGWLVPRARYSFRVDYQKFSRIRFNHLRGDFRVNQGVWEFSPLAEGHSTLVTYQARMVPDFYVPRWMMRSMLKRDLPELMRGLRAHAERAHVGKALPAASTNGRPQPGR